jgi:hypothetical protein
MGGAVVTGEHVGAGIACAHSNVADPSNVMAIFERLIVISFGNVSE